MKLFAAAPSTGALTGHSAMHSCTNPGSSTNLIKNRRPGFSCRYPLRAILVARTSPNVSASGEPPCLPDHPTQDHTSHGDLGSHRSSEGLSDLPNQRRLLWQRAVALAAICLRSGRGVVPLVHEWCRFLSGGLRRPQLGKAGHLCVPKAEPDTSEESCNCCGRGHSAALRREWLYLSKQ